MNYEVQCKGKAKSSTWGYWCSEPSFIDAERSLKILEDQQPHFKFRIVRLVRVPVRQRRKGK